MRKFLIVISMIFLFNSCENTVEILVPEYTDGSILTDTEQIPDEVKPRFEGIYSISKGAGNFGEYMALKWRGNTLSVFGKKLGSYLILKSGIKDSTILFEGYWRHALNTENGLIRLQITPENGARELINGDTLTKPIVFSGSYGFGSDPNTKSFELTFKRRFSEEAKKKFIIVAHRGGGRNSDYLGVSENSVEMIGKAYQMGANGIEIDVKLSKDNVPFLYHDPDINLRLTKESPIWGPIEDFSFSQIRTFLTLINGEQIPTLRETLEFVLNETELRFVWLDMKSNKNTMPYVIPLQKEFMQRAVAMGRDLMIAVGLPTEEKRQLFMEQPGYEDIFSINEGTVDEVRQTNSIVWAPRWTLGTQLDLVRQMQSEGRFVITWTIDQAQFMYQFMNEGEFNGFLTNYPTLAAYFRLAR